MTLDTMDQLKGGNPIEVSLVKLGTVITSLREFIALQQCSASSLLSYLLSPTREVDREALQLPLPCWGAVPCDLMQRMCNSLNEQQLNAVKVCSEFQSPFALLQGPPGTGSTSCLCVLILIIHFDVTLLLINLLSWQSPYAWWNIGKTKTVTHLINVLHLTSYQTHYHSVVNASLSTLQHRQASASPKPAVVETAQETKTLSAHNFTLASLVDMIEHANKSGKRRTQISPRPRMLICAPSNAGVDEIMARVAREGLVDGNARPYVPDMVRIGSTGRVRLEVYDVRLLFASSCID